VRLDQLDPVAEGIVDVAPVAAVCTENSNTHVVMVKPAEDRIRRDGIDPLNRAKGRSIFVQ
jgi:hypothetical protein